MHAHEDHIVDLALLKKIVDLLAVIADRILGGDFDGRDLPRPGNRSAFLPLTNPVFVLQEARTRLLAAAPAIEDVGQRRAFAVRIPIVPLDCVKIKPADTRSARLEAWLCASLDPAQGCAKSICVRNLAMTSSQAELPRPRRGTRSSKLAVLLLFISATVRFATDGRAADKAALGPWLMDLQVGKPFFDLPEKIDPAELALAPPEIRKSVEETQGHFKAKEKLKQMGTNAVPLLFDLLRASKDLNEKEKALIALDHLQPPPEMVLSELAKYLNTGELAETAALVLARQGPLAVRPLLSARTNQNAAVRAAIAWQLMNFHPDEKGALRLSINGDDRIWPKFPPVAAIISPALLEFLEDADPVVRYRAAVGLGLVRGDPVLIVPALIRHLKDSHPTVRSDAAEALGHYGENARVAAPDLARALHDPVDFVRSFAASALKAIGVQPPREQPSLEIGAQKLGMILTPGCFFLEQPEGVKVFGNGRLLSKEEFTTPLTLRAIIKTDITNIRLYFAKGMLILNWELNPHELRLHDVRHGKPGAFPGRGFVEVNAWHEIQWVIGAESTQVFVDGAERVNLNADHTGVKGPVGLGAAQGSTVTVKEFEVRSASERTGR